MKINKNLDENCNWLAQQQPCTLHCFAKKLKTISIIVTCCSCEGRLMPYIVAIF